MITPLSIGLLVGRGHPRQPEQLQHRPPLGPVFQWEKSRWFNKNAFDQAHAFYERYGGITIVAARFMPFLRTFAPFVAGVARMTRSKFTLYDVSGAVLWVGGVTMAGYLFGNILGEQHRQDHLGGDPRCPA